ncbi:MAG: FAD:protein FMN transferase [candidate division WOR-3 bacterium]
MRRLIFCVAMLFFISCKPRLIEVEKSGMVFGSYVRIKVIGESKEGLDKAVDKALQEMGRLDSLWSLFSDKSEVVRLNRNKKGFVSEETRDLLKRAHDFGERTGGVFDITVEPLLRVWGFYDGNYQVPESAVIAGLLERVDCRGVVVKGESVVLGNNVNIDLGGIAVGYAVDRVVELLQASGVKQGLIDAGGDIRVFGNRDWRVGVQHPRKQGVVKVLQLRERAVSTSGDYEQFFEREGKRFCHIIDPRTGYPAQSCAAVTVIAPNALEADVYATTLFVLGVDEGREMLKSLPGVEAYFFEARGDSVIIIRTGGDE